MRDPLFAPREHDVARVALPVPIDALFDYAVPPALAAGAQPGCRVRVRLRRRPLVGVIVERGVASDFSGQLSALEQLLDPAPVLSSALLGVLRDAAEEALCPIGMALAAALPAGSAPRSARGFALTPRGRHALAATSLPEPARARAGSPFAVAAGDRRVGRACERARRARARRTRRSLRADAGAARARRERARGAPRAGRRRTQARARARAGPGRALRTHR